MCGIFYCSAALSALLSVIKIGYRIITYCCVPDDETYAEREARDEYERDKRVDVRVNDTSIVLVLAYILWMRASKNFFNRRGDVRDAHSVVLKQLPGLARLAELVVHADKFHRHGTLSRKHFGNSAAEAAGDLMLFDGDDGTRALARLRLSLSASSGFIVCTLMTDDGDSCLRSSFAAHSALYRSGPVANMATFGVSASHTMFAFPISNGVSCCRHERRLFAREAHIYRARMRRGGERRFARLLGIARRDDGHVRLHAHECHIFERLMRRAVGADREPACEPAILTGTLLKEIVVRICSLLRPGRECRIRRDERDFAVVAKPLATRRQILLGDAELDDIARDIFL